MLLKISSQELLSSLGISFSSPLILSILFTSSVGIGQSFLSWTDFKDNFLFPLTSTQRAVKMEFAWNCFANEKDVDREGRGRGRGGRGRGRGRGDGVEVKGSRERMEKVLSELFTLMLSHTHYDPKTTIGKG